MPRYIPDIQSTEDYLTGEEREYVINCIYPSQSITLLTAPPGAGKTKFALASARSVATGSPFLDQYVQQGKIAYLNLDRMYKGDIEARLIDLCIDDQLETWVNEIVWVEEDVNLMGVVVAEDEDGNKVKVADEKGRAITVTDHLCKSFAGYKLIIIDTWHKLCVNSGLQEDSSDDTDQLMKQVRALAQSTTAAIVILHHTPKSDPSQARGSSAIQASVDHVLNLEGKADSELKLKCIKTRTDKIHVFPITIDKEAFQLNLVDADKMGQPVGAWATMIQQKRKLMTEEERRFVKHQRQFLTRLQKHGEKVGTGEYGMHRDTLLQTVYKGKKALLDQLLDHFRKQARIETRTKGKNPFYVLKA